MDRDFQKANVRVIFRLAGSCLLGSGFNGKRGGSNDVRRRWVGQEDTTTGPDEGFEVGSELTRLMLGSDEDV